MDALTQFGELLAQARAARGLTQVDLARRVGAKQPNIALIEADEREPRLAILRKIAGALGTEIVIRPDGSVEFREAKKGGRS